LIDENRQQREVAAGGARLLIGEEVARFLANRAPRKRRGHTRLAPAGGRDTRQTLEQARRMLSAGKPTDDVLEYLANTLTNRLLHAPTQA